MYENYIKRPIDFVSAAFLFIAALPVFGLIALAIKLSSRGPAIFTQQRSGLDGKTFKMRKFRTMASDNDVHDASKENNITPVGKFLRGTSLDELPQLINVIRGDMSFIGPRPWITSYYDCMNPAQRRRYDVRPCITGIAQVYGRNNLTIHQKINYDLRYVDHIGLREDLKVVFLTIAAVVSKEGQEMGKGSIHRELVELRSQLALNYLGEDSTDTDISRKNINNLKSST